MKLGKIKEVRQSERFSIFQSDKTGSVGFILTHLSTEEEGKELGFV